MLRRALSVLVLAASTSSAEPPPLVVCRGHEPGWSLRIEGAGATLATLDTPGVVQTVRGRLQETFGNPPSFVYRGRPEGATADLVAVITREACADTMADASEGGGTLDYAARVSMPDGAVRQGCCTVSRAVSAVPAPEAGPLPSAPASSGEITMLVLADGRECKATGKGSTLASHGRRLLFDCGISNGDRLGIVGPLVAEPSGLLTARRALVEWQETEVRKDVGPLAARAVQIALADGLTCRESGKGATVALGGRRASYTCGEKDGETVALLGSLEPVEGGFRTVRARLQIGQDGVSLVGSEPILVRIPQ